MAVQRRRLSWQTSAAAACRQLYSTAYVRSLVVRARYVLHMQKYRTPEVPKNSRARKRLCCLCEIYVFFRIPDEAIILEQKVFCQT